MCCSPVLHTQEASVARSHTFDCDAIRLQPRPLNDLELRLPIQHRQGRVFSYRTYATLPGLLTARLRADLSLQIDFTSAASAKAERLALLVPASTVRLLEPDYRARLVNRVRGAEVIA